MNFNQDKCATLIRAHLAAKMVPRKDFAKSINIDPDIFYKFLRRRVNLLDSDLLQVLEELDLIDRFGAVLSGEL